MGATPLNARIHRAGSGFSGSGPSSSKQFSGVSPVFRFKARHSPCCLFLTKKACSSVFQKSVRGQPSLHRNDLLSIGHGVAQSVEKSECSLTVHTRVRPPCQLPLTPATCRLGSGGLVRPQESLLAGASGVSSSGSLRSLISGSLRVLLAGASKSLLAGASKSLLAGASRLL